MPETLGALIRERRRDLGLTQEQLAERIGEGVRQSDISRLERDQMSLPRRDRLQQIAASLDLSIGDLLVLTGWMDDQHRRSLDDGATPAQTAKDDSVSREVLMAAVEALDAARLMMIETSALLDAAEHNLARVLGTNNSGATSRVIASQHPEIVEPPGSSVLFHG